MKLKKIASLALAGVMAVSMLAGCSTTSVEPTPNPDDNDSVVTPASGYSATFAGALTGAAAKKITMEDNADLTAKLNDAMGNLSSSTLTKFFTAVGGSDVLDLSVKGIGNLQDVKRLTGDMGSVSVRDAFKELVPSDKELTDEGYWEDKTVTMLFAVDGLVDENKAVEQVAADLNDEIGLLYRDNDSSKEHAGWGDVDHTTLGYEYTGSVSVASKTWVDNTTVGVHVIAVQITRTAIA